MTIILLLQFNEKLSSRTYRCFSSYENSLKYLLSLFKYHMPVSQEFKMKYFIDFIFSMYDFAFLSDEGTNGNFNAMGKDWFIDYTLTALSSKLN